jgi:SAM-dependent methyltransferase
MEEWCMKPVDFKDIYWDGRHYDLKYKDLKDDIPFYLQQAEKYGNPVLELGCGTGRITIPLAEKGFDITGLDILEPMLELAKKKAEEKEMNIKWVLADCRNFRLGKKFNLIFFPFSSIAHLHDLESIKACFSCVKEHLTDEGRFIIDYFNPRLDYLLRDPNEKRSIVSYPDPDGSGTVEILETNVYDTVSQINRIKWVYKTGKFEEVEKELNMRIFYPKELDALVQLNGLDIEAKFGNFDESPFNSDSPKQIMVCRIS